MGSKPQTVTQTSDPWATMPDWLKEAYQSDTEFRKAMIGDAVDMGDREILGMNPEEEAAHDYFLGQADKASGIGDMALGAATANQGSDATSYFEKLAKEYGFGDRVDELGGYDGGYTPGTFEGGYEPGTFEHGYEPTDFTGASGYETQDMENTYTGDRLTSMLDGKDFGLDYTDNVVDTTLAGMQRQADRERLAREAKGAAIGGTSNTRTSVGNAVADQLTGMNMAEMEAKLRDDAQRFGTEALFKQAGMLDESDLAKGRFDMDTQQANEAMRQFAAGLNLDEASLTDASKQFLSSQDLTVQELQDAASQFLSQQDLSEQELADMSAQFASSQDLTEQELENAAKEFGLNFDKGMLDTGMAAKEFGMNYDQGAAAMLDALAGGVQGRGGGVADIMRMFGQTQRGIDQSRADAPRDTMDWIMGLLSGTQNKGQVPVGNTSTTTQPGNSALQNILGIGTSLGGMAFAGGWQPFSDERVKDDIEIDDGESALDKLAKLESYTYRYKEGFGPKKRTTGLMAQDLEKSGIEGVIIDDESGFKRVDPYPILATVVKAVNELERERHREAA